MKSLIYKILKFFKNNLKGTLAFFWQRSLLLCRDQPTFSTHQGAALLVIGGQFDGDGQVIAQR